MKSRFRFLILLMVMLVSVWLVARGQAGCGVVPYEAEVTMKEAQTTPAAPGQPAPAAPHANWDVYDTAYITTLDANGAKTFKLKWYGFQGMGTTKKGFLTIIGPGRSHLHVPYEAEPGVPVPIDL